MRILLTWFVGLVLAGSVSAVEVFNSNTVWRAYWTTAPAQAGTAGQYQVAPRGECVGSPPVAAGWQRPDFDDQGWAFVRHVAPGAGHIRGPGNAWNLSDIYLRARFGVTAPAQLAPLTLEVVFRGGAIVYLNGEEVGRAHIGPGVVTLAADYPTAVFLTADGKAPLPLPGAGELDGPYRERLRTAKLVLPPRLIKPGVNVVAIHLVRAAYRPEVTAFHWHGVLQRTLWATVGFDRATLTTPAAAGLAVTRPAPAWNATPMTWVGRDVSAGDPLVALQPVRLAAPRNGVASGQVVFHSARGLVTRMTDLRTADGAVIPTTNVQVRFAQPDNFDALGDRPVADGMQPVWLTVTVPATARAGQYTGALQVPGGAVPVALTVHDWLLPAPSAWQSWVTLLQSPESVALHYGVPLWSDKHFALLEPSLKLLGAIGNKWVVVPAVRRGYLGTEPLVMFRREGQRLVPDLRVARRYLQLWAKHAGEPKVLCLQLWEVGHEVKRGPTLPVSEWRGDQVVPADAPQFGEPGSEELWGAVIAGMRGIVRELGWKPECLMIGTSQDTQPKPATVDFFMKVAPDLPWVAYTHGSSVPAPLKLGLLLNPDQRSGYTAAGWRHPRGVPNPTNLRQSLVQDSWLPNYRQAVLSPVLAGQSGCGGFGLDFWPVPDERGNRRAVWTLYDNAGNWYRIIRGAVRTLTAPGPNGALATVRYEVFREGIQETEALIFADTHKADPRLGPELAARVAALRPRVAGKVEAMLIQGRACDLDWWSEQQEIYECASAVARSIQK